MPDNILTKIENLKNNALAEFNKGQYVAAVLIMLKGIEEDPELHYPTELLELVILYVGQEDVLSIERWIRGFR